MKCIHCGSDTRGRDRTANGGRCSVCSHRFAFEPLKDPHQVTDGQFHAALQRVSPKGGVSFTDRQLWYEFNRKWMRPSFWRAPYGWISLGSGAAAVAAFALSPLLFPLVIAGGVGTAALLNHRANQRSPLPARPPKIPFDRFREHYLAVWAGVHGPVAGLVPAREAAALPGPREVAPDVAAFSFDRAVVTDRWEVAAMLVANRFHFEHNCAVLSLDGFPEGISGTVKEMLRRNPQLTVFALHDASPDGCLLPLTLREADWFPDPSVRVVDLGLRPETARRLRLPVVHVPVRRLPPRLDEVLPPEDVEWLAAGNTVELSALRPAQIMSAAYEGIRRVGLPGDPGYADGGWGPGGIIWVGGMGGGGGDSAGTDGFG
ncbi:MAG TPA: hypothetical protein VF263_11085 [Longimicrobiaceae bacterium]